MSGRHSRNLSASLYVRGISEKVRYVENLFVYLNQHLANK